MKYTILTIMLIISFCSIVSSQENTKQQKHFKVERAYPDGKQTSFGATLGNVWINPSGVKTEKYVFPNSYDEVWSAAKRAAEEFSRIGKRPINIEHDKGRISNSNIEDARNRESALIQTTWVDEIVTEVTQIDENHTKVAVSRKVFEIQTDARKNKVWANVASNGKVERWILTQIEDEINKGSPVSAQKDNSNNNDARKNEKFTVRTSGFTFVLDECQMSGGTVKCYFTVTSNDLDGHLRFMYVWDKSRMYDNFGNEFRVKNVMFGNKSEEATLIADVPIKMIITTEDFNASASEASLLKIDFIAHRPDIKYSADIKLNLRKIPIVESRRPESSPNTITREKGFASRRMGLELNSYCKSKYGGSASAVNTRNDAYSWRCRVKDSFRGSRDFEMNINEACQMQYGYNFKALLDNTTGWYCTQK
jgi:hypothetical protein